MSVWEAVLLGVVQGLTEFLPISSTAHLLVARKLLGHAHPEDAFTVVIQLGTLVAVFVYFRADVARLLLGLWSDARSLKLASTPDSRTGWLIVIGTVPAVAVGFTLKDWLKAAFFNLPSIAVVSIAFAALMAAAEWWAARRKRLGVAAKVEADLTWREALWVGLWQACALMPGGSRSGTTISGGLFAGLARATAARFSFLLSLPVILGAGLKELLDEYQKLAAPKPDEPVSLFASGGDVAALVVGTAVSAVVGYLAIAFLMRFLQFHTMTVFVVYRLVLAAAILTLLAAGVG
ncbi:udp pyrophosphate phosphatase : Undecaprenyl-diphosphatase OS=Chlorobium phaeobacteroides (strain BS1) GN=uppP PE=3 SV=1: BacA [Gemmataceae bacterium]|nr:udp pyrophosphate phosphatase : Undecaprenyl-diphosphatase OS=Chlorobium phaeobacteroides (strain BS1) GN=uppP PE=3 SV=1: BacA [Gemmataceae bacterium]VTU01268.1 udp pyrophosphate phosphatase : Undecaprenyl-diphosphatase OS=Chlorobium phaeobacteroides (strain BS1) GN=uppP PE=3 SV=1: BacA [Gemmataceae bacterium]